MKSLARFVHAHHPMQVLVEPRPLRTRPVSRRVVAAGVGTVCLPRFGRAAEVNWRIGHNSPAEFPLHVRLTEAAGVVLARSAGRMAIEVHANSELGSPVGLLAQLRAGSLDAAPLTGQILARDLPIAALPTVGFAFSGYERLWPAIDADLGRFIRTRMSEQLGLVAMETCWDFGFRQVTTSGKPASTAADMQGLRLRTPPEAELVALFQALKALPVAMPLSVVDRALRSHSIDGQESVVALVQAAGLSDVLSLCSVTNHVWDGQWLCVSGAAWSKLPADLRDIVASALNEVAVRQRQDTELGEANIRKGLEAAGMKFTAADRRGFRSVLRASGYYGAWKARMGDDGWTELRKYAGDLT